MSQEGINKNKYKKLQKLSEATDRKRGDVCAKKETSQQKKEARALSTVTSGVKIPKSF